MRLTRSGTTLLNGLISGGEAFPMLPECAFITGLTRQYHDIIHYGEKTRFEAYFGTQAAAKAYFADGIQRMIALAAANMQVERSHLVLKEPELTLLALPFDDLTDGRATYLGLMRDPRAVVASMVIVEKKRTGSYDLASICDTTFNYYYRLGQLVGPLGKRLLIVKYEDLAAKDEATFQAIEALIGYPVSRSDYREMSFQFDRHDPFYVDTYGQSIRPERAGGFREALDAHEVAHINRVFSGVLDQYGYQP